MRTTFQYPISTSLCQTIQMPKGAKILAVKAQKNVPSLWAEVDPDCETESRTFGVFADGQMINEDVGTSRDYIGTFQLNEDELAYHIYEYTGI